MPLTISRPASDEYAEFHRGYLAAVEHETDAIATLERQQAIIGHMAQIASDHAGHRYADGKWSVRQVLAHLADTERVMTYRLLRIARGDPTPLPGFDQDTFMAGANADARDLRDLAAELAAVRAATLALVRSLDDEALARRGVVNNWPLSARGIVFITAGHFAHHVHILQTRYNVQL